MNINHDNLVHYIIDRYKENELDDCSISFNTEKHYNYYGDRGVVDIVVTRDNDSNMMYDSIHLIEVKTYIDQVNKVIRQCNRMAEYFSKDHYFMCQHREIRPRLMLLATPENYKAVASKWNIFAESQVNTLFVHPENDDFVHAKMIVDYKDKLSEDMYRFWFEKLGVDQ